MENAKNEMFDILEVYEKLGIEIDFETDNQMISETYFEQMNNLVNDFSINNQLLSQIKTKFN